MGLYDTGKGNDYGQCLIVINLCDRIGGKIMSEYFEYLEELRQSGQTNMFGAGAYLQQEFGLGRYEARDILKQWMESYDAKSIA